MTPDSSLQASFWLMVLLQTIGSVDMPGRGPRKMPSPRSYIAILVAWAVLQIGADAGFEEPASVTGWVIVATGMVFGPFGRRLISVFNSVTGPLGYGTEPLPPQGTVQ